MAFHNPGRPFQVALVRAGGSAFEALSQAFDLLDDASLVDRARGLVVIKPNLTAPRPSGSGVVTDVAIVEGFVRLLRKHASRIDRIVIADGPGMIDAAECFRVAGYERLRDDYDVELVDLNRAATRTTDVPGWLRYPMLEMPEVVLDADLLVSITPVKTHTDGLYTLHAKNMFGVPPTRFYGRPRKAFHRAGVSEVVHDICRARPIDLAITDGTVGTELGAPIDGLPVPLGVLAVGWNAQAVDVVSCRLMGVDPRRSLYLNYLRTAGYGPISDEEIDMRGEELHAVARRFAIPDPASVDPRAQLQSAH